MKPFPAIEVEDKIYPTVILGGDRFCGVFGKPRHLELESMLTKPDYIYEMMCACYKHGFRGFDISGGFDQVIKAFRKLKNKYREAIGITNPNLGIYLNLEHNRAVATVFSKVFDQKTIDSINKLPKRTKTGKFHYDNNVEILTLEEIYSITFDEELLRRKLGEVEDLCDFCLIGTGPADYLPLLGRLDIFEDLIKIVREKGLIPMSIHHWTSITLPLLDKLDFAGHWVYLNKQEQILNEKDVINVLKKCKKPITAFKALLSREEENVKEYFTYLLKKIKVDAMVFGVEVIEEADLTSKILKRLV